MSGAGRLDPAAVAALYARHADELRAYLTGLLRDRELAAEVLQAAFVKAAEQGHAVREGAMRSWLFRVAHNEAIDRRRSLAAEGRSIKKFAWWKARSDAATERLPDQLISTQETAEQVRRAIESLPVEQQEVVRLRIYEAKTFAEIAALTDSPLGTVLTRMRLATKKLAGLLRRDFET